MCILLPPHTLYYEFYRQPLTVTIKYCHDLALNIKLESDADLSQLQLQLVGLQINLTKSHAHYTSTGHPYKKNFDIKITRSTVHEHDTTLSFPGACRYMYTIRETESGRETKMKATNKQHDRML